MSVAEEMANLFDVDISSNLDREVPSPTAKVPFESKLETMKAMTETEPAPVVVTVDPPKVEPKVEPTKVETPQVESQPEPEPVAVVADQSNPLGLDVGDLKAYEVIKKKYPRFRLYDGSQAYKHFYMWKVRILKEVLTRYPVLDIADMRKEIRDTNTDHCVNEKVVSPDLIREKLDNCYKCRVRVATLLSESYEQFPSWRRVLDMLKGKLFKDHEGNRAGAHKRDGMSLEHLSDIELYVKDLEGFIDAAKMIDNLLMAAAESLSRQLSCIQTRDSGGLGGHKMPIKSVHQDVPHTIGDNREPNELDGLDSVKDGEVIDNANEADSFVVQNWSVVEDDDILSQIG
jgi:hypothetical protein